MEKEEQLERNESEETKKEETTSEYYMDRYPPLYGPDDNEVRTMQQVDQDAWEWAARNGLLH